MNMPQPNNEEDAAYLGLAIADELIDVLIAKSVLTEADADRIFSVVIGRLGKANNFASKRAANFLAAWVQSKS